MILLKPHKARFQQTNRRFFLHAQIFGNVSLVVRRKKHFQVFLVIFLVRQFKSERGVLVNKNLLAFCEWCCHSVEPSALTCLIDVAFITS